MRYVDAFKNGRRNKTVFDDLRAVVHLGGVGFVRVDSHVDINAHKAHRAVRIGFLGSCSLRPDSAERDPLATSAARMLPQKQLRAAAMSRVDELPPRSVSGTPV